MQTAARFQTLIEIIDQVLDNPTVPVDRLLTDYLRQRRFIGSSDRRYLNQMVYSLLRSWISLSANHPLMSGRQAVSHFLKIHHQLDLTQIQALFNGDSYSPRSLSPLEKQELEKISVAEEETEEWITAQTPKWLWPFCQASFAQNTLKEMSSLNQIASLDLRVNSLKTDRLTLIKKLQTSYPNLEFDITPYSPLGLRLQDRYSLKEQQFWQEGLIEVQDEGSQLIALLTDAKPGMQVLDLCAGAGGKTLALAAAMHNKGKIFATDIYEWRLKRAKERLKRAGIFNVECRALNDSWLKRQGNRFDRVLVDAPCSGTGTWRRNPELKLRFQPSDLEELVQKQAQILSEAALTVKDGGRLVYATCSILKAENEDQVQQFLQSQPHFSLVNASQVWEQVLQIDCPFSAATLQLTPYRHQTDGFFISIFEKGKKEI